MVAGCFVFSLIRPGGDAGNATILADRETSALYVRIGDVVHPALNLTSARLIAGQAEFDEIEQILRSVLTEAWTRL